MGVRVNWGANLHEQANGNGIVEITFIALDDHQIVAPLIQNLLGNGSLCEQRIHRRDGATQITAVQQLWCGRDLVGLRLDAHLSQSPTVLMLDQAQQMKLLSMASYTTEFFSVECLALQCSARLCFDNTFLWPCRCQVLSEIGQASLQNADIDAMKHSPYRRLAGYGTPGWPQTLKEIRSVQHYPVSDGMSCLLPARQSSTYQGKQKQPPVPLAERFLGSRIRWNTCISVVTTLGPSRTESIPYGRRRHCTRWTMALTGPYAHLLRVDKDRAICYAVLSPDERPKMGAGSDAAPLPRIPRSAAGGAEIVVIGFPAARERAPWRSQPANL